ncbi:MAG: TIGR03986 family CRISPR-associated RAMP protein [Magnetococcales bacterium]|nr:TIGR03986 family CRISPR-associated RAMP protein [Magnetococcales bacterium]
MTGKPPPQAVHAPYNFVPLSPWIFEPGHKEPVSRDYPLREGISGVLELELTAHSPLLVGGEQLRGTNTAGRVPFFRLPNGDPAIPGSSIKGMIRNVLEIAAFGKMRMVDDKRLGLRDISGKHVAEVYRKSLFGSDPNNPHPLQAGLLRWGETGEPKIIPCRYAKISHLDMERWLKMGETLFERGLGVGEKYALWDEKTSQAGKEKIVLEGLPAIRFDVGEMSTLNANNPQSGAANLGQGDVQGALVFTGQVSDRGPNKDKKGKYKDFVFYHPDPGQTIAGPERLSPSVWQAFRQIHGDDGRPLKRSEDPAKKEKSLAGQYPWMDYWKERFFAGHPVPVFFRLDPAGRVMAMGLAYMFKRACDYSVGETVDHHSPFHRTMEKVDLVERLFGRIGEDNTSHDGWKGRATFGHFQWVKRPNEPLTWSAPTILNGPKPTYFPNYLEQQSKDGQLAGRGTPQYSTFMDENARIRGWKRYPARPGGRVAVQPLLKDQKKNLKVQVTLETLPPGTLFRGHLRVHNLRPEELGALIWALEWGGQEPLRHALGMGRPFGFGQVSLKIIGCFQKNLRPNDPEVQPREKAFYRDCFVAMMQTAYAKAHQGKGWLESPQLQTLLAMANPQQAEGRKLEHMVMGMKHRNDFVAVKQHGMVLAPYVETAPVASPLGGRSLGRQRGGVDPESFSPWVDQTIQSLVAELKSSPAEILRGKALAQRWQAMDDPEEKNTALREIKRRWDNEGLWAATSGKALKQAKAIYEAGLAAVKAVS